MMNFTGRPALVPVRESCSFPWEWLLLVEALMPTEGDPGEGKASPWFWLSATGLNAMAGLKGSASQRSVDTHAFRSLSLCHI